MALPPLEAEESLHHADEFPETTEETAIHGRSPSRIAFERLRKDKVAIVSAAVILFFVLVAIFAPLITRAFGVELRSYPGSDIIDINTTYGKVGPPDHGFTWDHPFGVEKGTGNDLLAEWVYGCRTSLLVASIATVLSTTLGILVGLIAGFSRGWLDRGLTFVVDLFLSFPFILGALTLAPLIYSHWAGDADKLGTAQFWALIGVLTIFTWMPLARLIRGEVFSLREREFVQAARVIGVPTRRILFRELLPNLIAPIVISISLALPALVTAEAGLAFLGIGLTERPSWGQTINKAVPFFDTYPQWLWAPVLGVMALVLALNLLGDSIRDAFDPKTRR
jgi:ABC-type dipeptide/oligopeptide/nickel transport system permease subunit